MKNLELLPIPNRTFFTNKKLQTEKKNYQENQKKYSINSSLWCALFFSSLREISALEQKKIIPELAKTISSFTSTITIDSATIIFEIRSSLRYFGGMKKLMAAMNFSVKEKLNLLGLNNTFYYGISPTINCSSIIARSKKNLFVDKASKIQKILGDISIDNINLDRKQKKIFLNMGVKKIKDIWRLPISGLKKRVGKEIIIQLNKAIGLEPELIKRYTLQERFTSSYNLLNPIISENKTLLILEKLLNKLCIFLQKRDLSTTQFLVILKDEKSKDIKLYIKLHHPSFSKNHFMILVKAHLENKKILSPITEITLKANNFQCKNNITDFMLPANFNNRNQKAPVDELNLFIETLTARIGEKSIKKPQHIDHHCPEYGALEGKINEKPKKKVLKIPQNLRPIWLFPKPKRLNRFNHQLYHNQKISLISGPERIESSWWEENETQRDYYIAEEDCGVRLWVFQDKIKLGQWFVHGVFS